MGGGVTTTTVGVLVIICITVFLVHRHRTSRERDAIATVEASQVEGPPPTPFGSSFVQAQRAPSITLPPPAYGPRTAAAVPQSAYSVSFTPRTPGVPQRTRTPYSSSHYSGTGETSYAASRGYLTPGPGLPSSPRANMRVTPRDKNTRFVIPEMTERKERGEEWTERTEALRTAPIGREGFKAAGGDGPVQVRSAGVAGVTGSFSSRLRPLFAGTSRAKTFV
ncbi:hypothetical protein AX15_007374 [Amanita polypyramis BW_CC]|nr:hypothetical protein AX15_007374 [Amanita polypyramis BW_CC]